MDIQGNLLADVCNIDYDELYETHGGDLTLYVNTINSKTEEMVEYIESEYEEDDLNIAYQVLGNVIVESGAAMTEELRERILQAAHEDEWAQDNEERKGFIEAFIKLVNDYG